MTDPVVLINIFEVPDSDAEEFITAWERTRDYLKTLDAHLDTRPAPGGLHQVPTFSS